MLHRTAKLTPFGRRLLVDRILIEGWPAATATEGISSEPNANEAKAPGGRATRSARSDANE